MFWWEKGLSQDRFLCLSTDAESPANRLTNAAALDPAAKIPEYKACAVKLEKVNIIIKGTLDLC